MVNGGNRMKKPTLYDKLIKYNKKVYPLHMPGHKLGRKINSANLAKIDVTEVRGTDNLHNPTGIISEAQEKAAITFGAEKTYFLVNGSTGGIISTISTICNEKDKILIARNCHKSVYNAILINNLEPIYIYPEIMESNGIVAGVDPYHIEENLIKYPSIKLVVITSPTYEGFLSNIEEIAKIVHKYNKVLMVDEAHGAHFKFNNYFPKTSIEQGADIVIQSTHKTLPAFTQSAMLHVQSTRIECNKLQKELAIFQSSSPSYILMNSLDSCRELLDRKGNKLFNKYTKDLKKCREALKNRLNNLKLIDKNVIGINQIMDIDYSKIVIDCSKTNITGVELDKILRNNYNIQVELSSINHIIAMTSICDSRYGIKKFTKALIEIDKQLNKINKKGKKYDIINHALKYYNPKVVSYKTKTNVLLKDSVGKIAGEFIIPFPPGIPMIVPGEIITKESIILINRYIDLDIEIMGLEDNQKTITIVNEV
jgi:lysine decarboxylase